MLTLDHVYFSYHQQPPYLLEDINLTIHSGSYISIVGENGSGKSTLLQMILGFLTPIKGTISCTTKNIRYVSQKNDFSHAGFPITVHEILDSYRKLLHIKDKSEVDRVLQLTGMSFAKDRLISKLSGGQSQRVSIARALIEWLRKYFSHHLDLILTIILSLSIGTAITLISSGKLKANANVFFFGSILTVNTVDMISIFILTILSIGTLYFLYNSLLYIAYDEEAARVAGVKVDLINYIFAILMAAAVSISIKIVGVLVLSSMIALPVASALQLERGFRTTLLCSIGFSLLAMLIGLFGSYYLNVAPGGFVSLTSVGILLVVIILKNIVRKVPQ